MRNLGLAVGNFLFKGLSITGLSVDAKFAKHSIWCNK